MNTTFNIWSDVAVPILYVIIPILGTYIGILLKDWLTALIGRKKLDDAIRIVEIVASGVEQMAKEAGWDGKEKFEQTLVRVKEWCKSKKINLTDEQWRIIIEQCVLALNKVWTELKKKENADCQDPYTPPPVEPPTIPVINNNIISS